MMNKVQAEGYVNYGINSIKMTKKLCTVLLPVNLLFLGVAILLYHQFVFVIIILCFALLNFISSLLFRKYWSIRVGFISQATQGLLLIIAFDCIIFGMYRMLDLLVWYEYLISLVTQIFAAIVCVLIAMNNAKNHNNDKTPVLPIAAGSVAGLACVSATILCKIFLTNASLSLVITIISVLINIINYLLVYVVVTGYYRANLIKQFDLKEKI